MKAYLRQASPPKRQTKAIHDEIMRQMAELDEKDAQETDAMILWVLHSEFGFGEKRLKQFYDAFNEQREELVKHYAMADEDFPWLCARKLKDAGIDISKFGLKED